MVFGRLVGRCGRASCGRGARASVEALRPVAASGLGAPASRPKDADAADARITVDMQTVRTVAATRYCVVSQIVQRLERARCSELHRFTISLGAQLAISPTSQILSWSIGQRPEGAHCKLRSVRRPKGATATCHINSQALLRGHVPRSVCPSIRVISARPGTPATPPAARVVGSWCETFSRDRAWSVCGSWDGVALRAAAAGPGRRSKLYKADSEIPDLEQPPAMARRHARARERARVMSVPS